MYEQLRRPIISVIIVIILSLQAFASFFNPSALGFPFVAYPMYRAMHHEGDRILYDTVVYAVNEKGKEAQFKPEDAGMSWWTFRRHVVNPLLAVAGWRMDRPTAKRPPQDQVDKHLSAVQKAVDAYCETWGRSVVRLRMEDLGVAVGRDGAIHGLPPVELASVEIKCSDR